MDCACFPGAKPIIPAPPNVCPVVLEEEDEPVVVLEVPAVVLVLEAVDPLLSVRLLDPVSELPPLAPVPATVEPESASG